MRYVILGARIVAGLIFVLFGLNGLLHFFNPPPPTGDALTWFGIMAAHHWFNFISVVQLVGGLLLLVNRFVPLGLTLLAPVIVNILLYHALLWPHEYAFAIVVLGDGAVSDGGVLEELRAAASCESGSENSEALEGVKHQSRIFRVPSGGI